MLLKQDNWYNVLSTRNTTESLKLLDKNITNYSRNTAVYVYDKDDERYKHSITPILYCKNCNKEIINLFIKTLNN
ncbi:hypothetical protein K9M50_01240 [Patescibacteria group bacterium]|nr:hypothetical protein [Patescibacteria group bacterium]